MSTEDLIGSEREEPFTVAGLLVTDVGGTLEAGVLSTPGMIGMMEHNATLLVRPGLPEGAATVGFEVSIKHVAAAFSDANCTAWARLDEVNDGRKFRFSVEVRDGDRVIGVGIHERRMIQVPPPATGAVDSQAPGTGDETGAASGPPTGGA